MEITNILVKDLFPHPDNPRKDLGDLTELADSIKQTGLHQNLTAIPGHFLTKEEWIDACKAEGVSKASASTSFDPHGSWVPDGYTIIIGHRRAAAAKLAGLEALPCVITEMDEKEQLQTMMVENMQRSDLTIVEQAQGFQMMMDLGDTVDEIAEKSGFSKTTVRRRIKLMELDADKLRKAEKRGATLSDYMELEKLEDPAVKNKVLDAVGTANFNSVLKDAMQEQAFKKRKEEWLEVIKTFATEDPDARYDTHIFVDRYSKWNLKTEVDVPADAASETYNWRDDGESISVYKMRTDDDADKEAREQEEREARRREEKRIEDEFGDISNSMFELRRDFVKELAAKDFKKQLFEITKMVAQLADGRYSRTDEDILAECLGITEEEDLDWNEWTGFISASEAMPEKTLFCIAYSVLDGANNHYWRRNWNNGHYEYFHNENADLDAIYDVLAGFGYEMSDMEKAMQNGTHEIFAKYGHKEDAENAE